VILPKVRDPRFITLRRGGTLTGPDHRLLALWAAACAEHVLPLFESVRPDDPRPRRAIEQARAWSRGEVKMMETRAVGGAANSAARPPREGHAERVGRIECRWQRDQLPEANRELVLDDQRLRNDICWSVFDC
jgi:hypothetical protein